MVSSIKFKGKDIRFRIKGHGKTIVLLHGFLENSKIWNRFEDFLSNDYSVVSIDLPGFGKSDEPKEVWDVSSYVQFVIDFLKDYDTKEVMLLGHSFGGRVIIKMHSRNDLPFKVTKVILVDSAGIMPPKSNKKSWRTRYYKLGRIVLSWGIVKKIFPDALENFRKKMGSADYAAASPMMRQVMVKVVNEDLEPYLPNI